jgi:chromosome segregation ATPase
MMSEALPGFQLASELGPSPSREEELDDLCHHQAEQIERLQDLATEAQPAENQPQGATIRPEEKQALVQLLSDLGERIKALELLTAKQAREIEESDNRILTLEKSIVDIKKVNDQTNKRVKDVKDLAQERIGGLVKEIVDIRENKTVDKGAVNEIRNDLDEALNLIDQHAEAINKVWKATKKAPVPTGKKTLARIEKLKEILRRGPKTYKELERLLDISPKEMNRLVSRLDSRSYEIFYRAGDDRQKVLRLRAWSAHPTNGAER